MNNLILNTKTWMIKGGQPDRDVTIEFAYNESANKWQVPAVPGLSNPVLYPRENSSYPKSGSSPKTFAKNLWMILSATSDFYYSHTTISRPNDLLNRRIEIRLKGKRQIPVENRISNWEFAGVMFSYHSGVQVPYRRHWKNDYPDVTKGEADLKDMLQWLNYDFDEPLRNDIRNKLSAHYYFGANKTDAMRWLEMEGK